MRFISHEVRTLNLHWCDFNINLHWCILTKNLHWCDFNKPAQVRTPLNSICMGLALLQSEIRSAVGDHSAKFLDRQGFEDDDSIGADADMDSSIKNRDATGWYNLAREIETNAQDAVHVLNDLLNYDKIEQGKLLMEVSVVSIWELIERATNEFKLPAAKKQLRFGVSFSYRNEEDGQDRVASPSSLPTSVGDLKVVGDPVRISQVLRNLISNALKFTPEGGAVDVESSWIPPTSPLLNMQSVTLHNDRTVRAERRGFLQVKVNDTGAGLSTEQMSRLYNDGVQFNVNELQAGQGSGLGLYIAKGIVEQHKGTLAAASPGLGHGTSFTLILPLWNIPETNRCSSQDVEDRYANVGAAAPGAIEMTPLRVLVVDDVLSNRKLLSRLLRNAGHICDEAEDGAAACEMVINSYKGTSDSPPYDSVLMDSAMPTME